MEKTAREQIIDYVKEDLIGPSSSSIQSEREIIEQTPISRYLAAILFSKGYGDKTDTEHDSTDDNDDVINLSNSMYQSAMGITAAVKNNDILSASVSFAFYDKIKSENSNPQYARIPVRWNSELTLPTEKNIIKKEEIYKNDSGRKVLFDIVCRQVYKDYSIYTFTIENASNNIPNDNDGYYCMFQNELSITSKLAFLSLPEKTRTYRDYDYDSNSMLYREKKTYAVGHGCSAQWNDKEENVYIIKSSIFPEYEMESIIPSELSGISLNMKTMSEPTSFSETIIELKRLCDGYAEWINKVKQTPIEEKYLKTKERHIRNCYACLERMREGMQLLEKDQIVRKAFQLMNLSMLMQQLHYNLPMQKWSLEGDCPKIVNPISQLPNPDNEETWFGDKNRYGKWRPFQLAFILINIRSMTEPNCSDRKITDLIWFPTGGGKTEAYLGLSAFTIFLRRLKNKNATGTTIIMRYTLRLLTNQQYSRASSLICAIENIRRNKISELGNSPITIGLWVGKGTTPNNTKDAEKTFNELLKKEASGNPFIVTKCPWCGCQMGFFDNPNNKIWKKSIGYAITTNPKRFIFRCENPKCNFSDELPLKLIDTDIYNNPPTLLIGTVDKFAQLPFKPEAKALFGIGDDGKHNKLPPELIIQDELHLISGPLGTMVGLYETIIEELCTNHENNLFPKVIASTATISRAKEQCNALYCKEEQNVFQFPPNGLSFGDSFFSKIGNKEGRKYVGIYCSNQKYSAVTANIRFYADIIYSRDHLIASKKEKDAYYTHVGYFNSIRELGRMKSYISQEVGEYLKALKERNSEKTSVFIINDLELTSRIDGGEIPEALDKLSIPYNNNSSNDVVDVCLATNMISVGIDIPRLGLMSVTGQPKTTSEYIQATSRVGRSSIPGLVFMLYTPSKPRDRSHYEHFQDYHSRIYCNVEPTSVTPFSGPVRERALGALLVTYIRFKHPEIEKMDVLRPKKDWIEEFRAIVLNRVNHISPEEAKDTSSNIDRLYNEWLLKEPTSFGNANGKIKEGQLLSTSDNVSQSGFSIPTSMRSVDESCTLIELKGQYE